MLSSSIMSKVAFSRNLTLRQKCEVLRNREFTKEFINVRQSCKTEKFSADASKKLRKLNHSLDNASACFKALRFTEELTGTQNHSMMKFALKHALIYRDNMEVFSKGINNGEFNKLCFLNYHLLLRHHKLEGEVQALILKQ